MAFKSLNEFCSEIEKSGELITLSEKANTDLEISEIADRMSKSPGGGKALLFKNNGTQFPVLMNMLGSDKRMKAALRVNEYDDVGKEIHALFKTLSSPKNGIKEKLSVLPQLAKVSAYMPSQKKGKAKCQEVKHSNPSLSILPVLKTWPSDAAPFITFPQVITKDPHTGIRNVGMYRMQIIDEQTTGMHWHKHKVGARHYNEYKQLNKKMPVAVALGGDPVLSYSASAPLPDNIDEYMLAGFLRKKKVRMTKALTQDIEVPADADIIIEGYIDPREELFWEGPFGDHTGFYSLPDWYPKFHVTAITHRKDAVYPATVVGIPPMEDAFIAKATERIFLAPIQLTMLPELADMNIPEAGVAHNLTIAAIDKSFAGHAHKVSDALRGAGQMMFNKMLIITDKAAPIHSYEALAQTLSQKIDPANDITFSKGPLDVLDHSSSAFAFGSKMTIDATTKLEEEKLNSPEFENLKPNIDKIEETLSKYNQITAADTGLILREISVLFLSVKKDKSQDIKSLLTNLSEELSFKPVKFLIAVDQAINPAETDTACWVFANNIEPLRDCKIIESKNHSSHLIIDGTTKTKAADNFKRRWPNVVTMDNKTIDNIDKKWEKFGLGRFIKSPSLKYLALKVNDSAEANLNK
ncbi:MAG: menaquinone biosynthesis decarboxylase [Bacteroidota bacterium]|nr:menaquinone biosynthesis decarboxylase [Bacteroidota bacterium]